jgi:outer membrane scaffolding protein for murein synthesis (MipA/OmpV family)
MKFKNRLFVVAYLSLPCSSVLADHKHLWEGGLGVGQIHAPFYRGANQSKDYYIPIPFIRFRGRIFAADEDGIRGKLFDSDRLKLDMSIAGSVPVPKDTEGARKDMPRLDPIGEIGPSLKYNVWNNPDKRHSVSLELPVRAVFSVGDPVMEYQGLSISPFINWLNQYRHNGVLWRFNLSMGPLWADQKFHDYFYQVGPQYTTATRSTYDASGGYSGSRLTFSISRNSENLFFGFFARFDDLSGASFENSPLVETSHYFVTGFAAVWIFSHSEQRAEHY